LGHAAGGWASPSSASQVIDRSLIGVPAVVPQGSDKSASLDQPNGALAGDPEAARRFCNRYKPLLVHVVSPPA